MKEKYILTEGYGSYYDGLGLGSSFETAYIFNNRKEAMKMKRHLKEWFTGFGGLIVKKLTSKVKEEFS